MKECYKCKESKELNQFGKDKRSPDGHRGICKQCRHDHEYVPTSDDKKAKFRNRYKHDASLRTITKLRSLDAYDSNKEHKKQVSRKSALKTKYGLTEEQYAAMVEAQDGVCAICKRNPNDSDARRNWLCVDHDHETGKVRELLCHSCNVAIAYFQEDPTTLTSAIDYLARHK